MIEVEVDRNDIEDDNLGIYGPQAEAVGGSAKQLPDEIIAQVVNVRVLHGSCSTRPR